MDLLCFVLVSMGSGECRILTKPSCCVPILLQHSNQFRRFRVNAKYGVIQSTPPVPVNVKRNVANYSKFVLRLKSSDFPVNYIYA